VANGEVQVGSPVEAGVVEAGDLVEIAYEDLVAVAGGQDLAQLAAEPMTIGAMDLVEVAYGDLVAIGENEHLHAGSLEVIDAAKRRASGGSSGSSARSSSGGSVSGGNKPSVGGGSTSQPKTYMWMERSKKAIQEYKERLKSPMPRFQIRCPTAVAACRG
jgi:hypothetical protein